MVATESAKLYNANNLAQRRLKDEPMGSADHEKEIGQLRASLYRVDGVQTVFLLGSPARGDAAEGAEVDLHVLFEDEKSLSKGREDVSKVAVATGLFTNVFARTVGEFWKVTERASRDKMVRDGRLIFLGPPIDAVSDSMVLLACDPGKLGKSDETNVRKGLQSLVKKGARWLGRGCLLLDVEDTFAAGDMLQTMGIDFELVPALLPPVRRSSGIRQGRGNRPRQQTVRK